MTDNRKPLDRIKSNGLSRGLSLLKASIKAGSLAAKQLTNPNQTPEEKAAYILRQVKGFTDEIGQLKGSAMKVGQLLSTYGEHFLPPEANRVLKSLQQKSPPVAWPIIEKQILNELGSKAKELEIDQVPMASASIGQVHKAQIKSTGQWIALKVQYPGVDKAIDSDLKLLKLMLSTLNLLPKGAKMDQIFDEVREMLQQEMDYRKELGFTEYFLEALKNDDRYVVPKTYNDFCTSRIMATEFIDGTEVDSEEVAQISIERRNALGRNYLELYLNELTKYKKVQTDPHFGNYRILLDQKGLDGSFKDKIVLFDFGAIRTVPEKFLTSYKKLMQAGLSRDGSLILEAGRDLNLLLDEDPETLNQKYVDLCLLITEPFSLPDWESVPENLMSEDGSYDWANSDLPKRVAKKGSEIAFNFKLRSPPRETVFLDRKLGGVFIFLKVLGCKLETRSLLKKYLN
ncbi:MAG: AarF/ABC1/UbiB kinase family protein [Bdellovibrionales bacterium]|nr:AarF/ABC1/UbiB kinase family protein [Bdellovibrionales bacterium]